jgi:hypothetical protein
VPRLEPRLLVPDQAVDLLEVDLDRLAYRHVGTASWGWNAFAAA